jgi:AP-3 complex subunit beta
MLVLKSLVQSLPKSSTGETASLRHSVLSVTSELASKLDDLRHPSARACVLWLVGQYAEADEGETGARSASNIPGVAYWVPDTLRKVTKTFATEVCICLYINLSLRSDLRFGTRRQ